MAAVAANVLGYAASSAVLASFLMRRMVPLRLVAILSNVLFLAYGYIESIHPVVLLHLSLLPINAWRLWNADDGARAQRRSQGAAIGAYLARRTSPLWITVGLAALASLLALIAVASPRLV